ncbi:MAG: MDR family MFS transporter [Planctomycetota bacterium]|nr:MDR family MFS transporter [Planctomycetota bacterium]
MGPPIISGIERRIITAAILCGLFLVAMDILVVSTAMPAIVAEFGEIAYYPWVVSIYILASTATVPLFGKLSDIYGRRPVYLFGMALFMLGSLGSGLSQSMGTLVASRALQGFGGGALLPVTLTIVGDLYSLNERARMQGVFSSVWGLASIVGPLVGGTLVETAGWRWIFIINLPLGVLAGLMVRRYLREPGFERRERSVPYLSAGLLAGSILLMLLGLLLPGMGHPWLSAKVILPLIISPVLLLLFIRVDSRGREPVLDRRLFEVRIVRWSIFAGFFVSACLYGAAHYVPLFVSRVQAKSAMLAGFALTPMSLGWVLAAFVGGRLILRLGYRAIAITGLVLVSTGAGLLGTLHVETPYEILLVYMGVTGLGLGLSMTCFIVAVQNSVAADRLGAATSALQLFRLTGSVVGVAALGAIFLTAYGGDAAELSNAMSSSGMPGEAVMMGYPMRQLLASSLRYAFLGGLCFSVVGLLCVLGIPGGKAEQHLHESRREDI